MDVVLEGSMDADQSYKYAVALSRLPHVVAVKLTTANYVNGQRIGERPAADVTDAYLTGLPNVDLAAMRLIASSRRYVEPPLQVPSMSAD